MKLHSTFGAALVCLAFNPINAIAQDAPAPLTEITHLEGAEKSELDMVGQGNMKVYYKSLLSSKSDAGPLSCSLFKIENGDPVTNIYEFTEVKLIIEGSINIESGEKKFTAKEGDVVYIPTGSEVKFSSDDSGTAFLCAQH